MLRLMLSLCGLALLVGCAPQPETIKAQRVPFGKFVSYNCAELSAESFLISDRATELYHELRTTADNDKVQALTGLLIVPVFFLDPGDSKESAEFARLKGEYDVIKDLMERRKCADQGQLLAPSVEENIGARYRPNIKQGDR